MQEIGSIFSGQMNQNKLTSTVKPSAAEGFSFIDAARSVAASQIAVAERGYVEEMNLRKKEEVNLDILNKEDGEEDDIFDLIRRFQNVLERFK